MYAMLANMIIPHATVVFKAVVRPMWKRCRARRKAVSQRDMDRAYEGARFELEMRYAYVLNTLAVCYFYAGGIPSLLPIAIVSLLITFWVDKWLLLRFYRRPPAYNAALARSMTSQMPYILLLHLSFSAWMYGNGDIFETRLLNPEWVGSQVGIESSGPDGDVNAQYQVWVQQTSDSDPFGIVPRAIRLNVFPIAVFILLLLLFLLTTYTLRFWSGVASVLCCCCRGSLAQRDDRTENRMPAFTEEFFRVLPAKKAKSLARAIIRNRAHAKRARKSRTTRQSIKSRTHHRKSSIETLASPSGVTPPSAESPYTDPGGDEEQQRLWAAMGGQGSFLEAGADETESAVLEAEEDAAAAPQEVQFINKGREALVFELAGAAASPQGSPMPTAGSPGRRASVRGANRKLKTWEVLKRHGQLHLYRISLNPRYRVSARARARPPSSRRGRPLTPLRRRR